MNIRTLTHKTITQTQTGMHWNPRTHQYETLRTNLDNAPAAPLPARLREICGNVMKAVGTFLSCDCPACFCVSVFQPKSQHKHKHNTAESKDPVASMPPVEPDIAIVNFYAPNTGRLGVHQDVDETQASIKAGLPVISLSGQHSSLLLFWLIHFDIGCNVQLAMLLISHTGTHDQRTHRTCFTAAT